LRWRRQPHHGVSLRKTRLFEQFIYKNDHFAKTGSGQTWEKLRQKGVVRTSLTLRLPHDDQPHLERFARRDDVRVAMLQENGTLLEFLLCLSRACLGKMIISM
jgi:hypothetical protein